MTECWQDQFVGALNKNCSLNIRMRSKCQRANRTLGRDPFLLRFRSLTWIYLDFIPNNEIQYDWKQRRTDPCDQWVMWVFSVEGNYGSYTFSHKAQLGEVATDLLWVRVTGWVWLCRCVHPRVIAHLKRLILSARTGRNPTEIDRPRSEMSVVF